jgi:hypothetical protein
MHFPDIELKCKRMSYVSQKRKILDYSGPLNFQIRKALLHILQKAFLAGLCTIPETNPKTMLRARKRCTYILEELLSQVQEYYGFRKFGSEHVHVSLERDSRTRLQLCISNTVTKSDTHRILKKIEIINNESPELLRLRYLETLQFDRTENSIMGIGLRTVRLKTGTDYFTAVITKHRSKDIFRLSTTFDLYC